MWTMLLQQSTHTTIESKPCLVFGRFVIRSRCGNTGLARHLMAAALTLSLQRLLQLTDFQSLALHHFGFVIPLQPHTHSCGSALDEEGVGFLELGEQALPARVDEPITLRAKQMRQSFDISFSSECVSSARTDAVSNARPRCASPASPAKGRTGLGQLGFECRQHQARCYRIAMVQVYTQYFQPLSTCTCSDNGS
jgi:hypothetical protein